MTYLFILVEVLFCYFLYLLFFSFHKNWAEDSALALVTNLFLSVISLIFAGLLLSIHFWWYLFFKAILIAAIFLVLKINFPLLEEAHRAFQKKIMLAFKSPLHILALFFFLILFLNAFGRFPVEWDSYSYHLPMSAVFLKKGILSHYQYYGVSIGSYYPHSIELLFSLFFSLDGVEQSSLVNSPSVVLLFLSLYLLARRFLNIKKEISLVGALAFLLLPIIQTHFYEAYVDLYFLAFCLLALYFLFELYSQRQNRYLLFLLLIGSLMLSTRYQGLSFVFFLGLGIIIFFLKYKFWKSTDWKLALSLPGVVFVGTFFYVRNFILTKNPLFPANINLLGILHFPGHYDFSLLTAETSILFSFPQIASEVFPTLLRELSLGFLMFLFLWISPLFRLKKVKQSLAKNSSFLILFLIFIYLFYNYLTTPYSALNTAGGFNFSLRLGLFFLALLYLISLKLASSLGSKLLIFVLLLGSVGLFLLGKSSSLCNLLLGLLALLLFWGWAQLKKLLYLLPGFFFLLMILIIAFKPQIKKWENYFADSLHLEQANIAYAGTNRHFQLYDRNLNFNVLYLNVNRAQNLKWNKERDLSHHKQKGNFLTWLKNMKMEDVDYLVLYDRYRNYIESTWVRENPRFFSRERENIFRVNKKEIIEYLTAQE